VLLIIASLMMSGNLQKQRSGIKCRRNDKKKAISASYTHVFFL
jgi:hypothetical protein